MTDIHPAEILGRCGGAGLVRAAVLFDEIDSTNRAAASSTREGILFIAERQRAGYGRSGRSWHSAGGKDLLLSLTLRPVRQPEGLTSLAALACARLLGRLSVQARIKWPNDIYIGKKKAGGLLAESRGGMVVLGLGLNVNGLDSDFPAELKPIATSVRIETGIEQERSDLIVGLMGIFEALYAGWSKGGLAPYAAELESLMLHIGRPVVIESGSGRSEGIMMGVAEDGRIRLEVAGEERRFAAGDLSLRRLEE